MTQNIAAPMPQRVIASDSEAIFLVDAMQKDYYVL